jgi:hypothetical protein
MYAFLGDTNSRPVQKVETCLINGLKSSVKEVEAYSTKRREASQVKASQKLKIDPRPASSQPIYNTIPCTRKYKRF